MKKILILLFCISIYKISSQNLISNPSFENHKAGEGSAPCKDGQAGLMESWENDAFFPSSLFCQYNTCSPLIGKKCDCLGCADQIKLIGYPPEYSGFHTPDWLKTEAQHEFLGGNPFFHIHEVGPSNNYNIRGRTGSGLVGMGISELIEQRMEAPLSPYKTYVFTAYIRIPRLPERNGNVLAWRSTLKSPCQDGSAELQGNLTNDQKFYLDVYLSTDKVKYQDGSALFCSSTTTSKIKNSNNNIHLGNSFELSVNSYPVYEWHKITKEITCPEGGEYKWLTIELSGGGEPYILIDDVSLIDKCNFNCTQTSGIPQPLIATSGNGNCMQGQVSNIQNIRDLKIEVFALNGVLVRTQQFYSTNGFSGPRYWDGNTHSGSPAAAATYIMKATCINDCGTFVFSNQISQTCQIYINPPDIVSQVMYNECCEINIYLNGLIFDWVTYNNGLPQEYKYRPQNGIYVNDCVFTSNSYATLIAGQEIVFSGETNIKTFNMVDFHAYIEECPDAHRLSSTKNTTRNYEATSDSYPISINDENNIELKKSDLKPFITLQSNGTQIIPNPSNGSFKIISDENEGVIKSIEIQNTLGITIQTIYQTGPSVEVNIQEQPAGLYLVKLNYRDKVVTKKVIKQ